MNTNMEAQNEYGKEFFSWKFPEYMRYDRGFLWYASSLLLSIILIAYAIFSGNFLFAFIIVMVMIITLMHSVKEPAEVECSVYEEGIKVGNKFFPWKEFKHFWIAYDPPEVKKLFLDFQSAFRPHLSIELQNQNPLDIRETLLQYLEEDLERDSESTLEELGRLFRL